jgi:hypothetical protein
MPQNVAGHVKGLSQRQRKIVYFRISLAPLLVNIAIASAVNMKNRTISAGYSGTSGVVEGSEDGGGEVVVDVGVMVGEGDGLGVG